jgi:hypothetical protein
MRKFAWNGLTLVGIAVVLFYGPIGLFKLIGPLADDEAPIRVRNGSLLLVPGSSDTNTWRWKEKSGDDRETAPSYSHELDDSKRDEDLNLWVLVVPKDGIAPDCGANGVRFDGEIVRVKYRSGNIVSVAKIRRGNRHALEHRYRTRVRPRGDFEVDRNGALVHKTAGAGSISEVRSDNGSCSFSSATDLEEIRICSSANAQACMSQ